MAQSTKTTMRLRKLLRAQRGAQVDHGAVVANGGQVAYHADLGKTRRMQRPLIMPKKTVVGARGQHPMGIHQAAAIRQKNLIALAASRPPKPPPSTISTRGR